MASPWYVCGTGYERAAYNVHCHICCIICALWKLTNYCISSRRSPLFYLSRICRHPCHFTFLNAINSNFTQVPQLCVESYEEFVNVDAFVKIPSMYSIKICAYVLGCLTILFFPSRYVAQRSMDRGKESPWVSLLRRRFR